MNIISKVWDEICEYKIDHGLVRIFLLLFVAGVGLLLGICYDVKFFYQWFDKKIAEYLNIAIIGIPVFTLLWYFRTRDVRQQIEKTQEQISKAQEQIQQSEYADAVNNIASTDRLKIDVGVKALITLSEIAPKFNGKILSVFMERLKHFNLDESKINGSMPLTYGVEILIWLNKHFHENEVPPRQRYRCDTDLSYQTFYKMSDNLNFDFVFKFLLNITSFRYANLRDVNLQNINLRNADLTRANLGYADLRGVNLINANLTEANLWGAKADEKTKGIGGIWIIEEGEIHTSNDSPNTSYDWNNIGFYGLINPLESVENLLCKFDNAIEIDEKFARAIYNRGYVHFLCGNIEKSDKNYNEAQKLDGGNLDFMPYPKFRKLLSRYR